MHAHFQTPGKVRRTGRDNSTPRDVNSDDNSRLSSLSPGSNPNSVYPARFRNQEVISPSYPSIAKRGKNAELFDAPIDGYLAVNVHSTSYFREELHGEVDNVNESERMKFASNFVLNETPKFMDLGLSPANTTDKLNSVFVPATRAEWLTDNSNWIASIHGYEEVTVVGVREVKAYRDYIKNS